MKKNQRGNEQNNNRFTNKTSSMYFYGVDQKVQHMDEYEWKQHDAWYGIICFVVAGSIEEA